MGTAAAPAARSKIIEIDRKSRIPYYQQIYDSLRSAVEGGKFTSQDPLPTPAALATDLDVSKTTVRRAFHKLAADGLLLGDATSGYQLPPVEQKVPEPETNALPAKASEPKLVVCRRISALDKIDFSKLRSQSAPRPFSPGFPDTQEFPLEIWEGLRSRLLRERAGQLLDSSDVFGHLPLRESIASRLRNARGLRCSPDQVVICAGAQSALNLVINTLVSPGDAIGMEEPGYYNVKAAFLQAGAKVFPLLVDDEGLTVPDARRQNPPLLVYTTPPNQFPLGTALTLPRRQALLDFARQTNTWVLEDDSDADFSYTGSPLPSLQGTDDQNRVVYLGTTGKTLFPSLEIGYAVVPPTLVESFLKTKELMGGKPCTIDQATLANFLAEGHFDRHLHRMNVLYYERLQALSQSVGSELSGLIDLEPAKGGLHAVGWLARGLDEKFVAASAANAGIDLPLLSSYGKTAMVRPGVVFGFASFTEKKIKETVQRLGKALRSPEDPSPESIEPSGLMKRLFRR